ncbi:hypothetical protein C0J52_25800 [Blattella germanica]|nr:hypothetical protein C0J52_25800 [Blattella germanica]
MQLKTAIILILGIPGECIICYFCGKYELEMTCAKGIEKAWNITCDKGDVCGVILLQSMF